MVRPLLPVLGVIAAMVGGTGAVIYELLGTAGCDGAGYAYVTSFAQCQVAAAAVDYADTTAEAGGNADGGFSYPTGCYTRNNALWFNAGAAADNYALSPSRDSICIDTRTASPTLAAAASGYVQTSSSTCADAGFDGLASLAECETAATAVGVSDTATEAADSRYNDGCLIVGNTLYWNPTGTASEPANSRNALCRMTLAPTAAPTAVPTTSAPTAVPTTSAPTAVPTTSAPTAAPTTSAPVVPTTAPTTSAPSAAPTTAPTTSGPTTAPTVPPVTSGPTESPSTSEPTTSTPTPRPTTAPTTTTPTFAGATFAPTIAPTPGPTPGPTIAGTPCTSHNTCDVADYCGGESVCVSCAGCGAAAAATPSFAGLLPCWSVCDLAFESTAAAPGGSTIVPPQSDGGGASSDTEAGSDTAVMVLAVFAALSLVICMVVVLFRTRNMTEDDGQGGRQPASFRKKMFSSFTNIDFNNDVNRWSAPVSEDVGYASIGNDHARINAFGRTALPPSFHRSHRSPGTESSFGYSNAKQESVMFSYNPTYDEGTYDEGGSHETGFDYGTPAAIEPTGESRRAVARGKNSTYEYGVADYGEADAAEVDYDEATAAEAGKAAPVVAVAMRPKKAQSTNPKPPPRIVYNAGPPKAPPRSSVLMNPGFRDSMASTNGAIYQQAENDELDGVGGLYEEPIAAPTYRDDSAPMYEASGPVYNQPLALDEPLYEVAPAEIN